MKISIIYTPLLATVLLAGCEAPQDRCEERREQIVLKDGSVITGDPIVTGDCLAPALLPAAPLPPGGTPPGGGGGSNPPPGPDPVTGPEATNATASAGNGAAADATQPNEYSQASAQNSFNGGDGASAGAREGDEASGDLAD